MAQAEHHHRSTTKANHKSFKSRHATKSALKEKAKGKIDAFEKGVRRTPHQHLMSKLDRKNQAKQIRQNKHAQHLKTTSVFSGRDAAPRVVAVVPLSEDASASTTIRALNASLDLQDENVENGRVGTYVERFKQSITYSIVRRDLFSALDACRGADFVVFVLSAAEEVDELGELILRAIEGQGVSNTLVVAQGVDSVEPAKRRPQILASLKSYISHFLPSTDKVSSLDSRQECLNVIRTLCTTTPKGIHWREERSWLMVEEVRWLGGKQASTTEAVSNVVLTGVVRGKNLKAERLLQIGDWGCFQIEKITAAPLLNRKKPRSEAMGIDAEDPEALLQEAGVDQDDSADLAPEEVLMDDVDDMAVSMAPSERKGVLVDDHHYFSDEETRLIERLPKKLPRGTSKYQASWFLDDMSDSGSDLESVDENMFKDEDGEEEMDPADGMGDVNMGEATEGGPSEYPQSEMFLDPSPEDEAEEISAYRRSKKNEGEDDREFPDEIELAPGVLARERLQRYRGLKSLKTSVWDTEEDRVHEPDDWRRLLEISNYKAARNRVLDEALVGGVQPGIRCNVYVRSVPTRFSRMHDTAAPLTAFSLLRHEQKRAAVNFSINLSSSLENPLRSKDELIMQCGPRRFIIHPLFSQAGNTPNDVHKFSRYLHPGRSAIATFIAPITWGSVPALFFRRSLDEDGSGQSLSLIGTGTSLPPSQSRVVAKRIVLTGHPFKINKRLVTIRYMFFNAEDVAWFKALSLWTKRGRTGHIKDSLGTHGYFKATFDGRINPMDSIGVSLYKRVWPRPAKLWAPSEEKDDQAAAVPDLTMVS